MQRLRNRLTTEDGSGLSNFALILVVIAFVVVVALLSLGGENSTVWRGVGSSV
jgi:Flp pilus assembly pilin Flp